MELKFGNKGTPVVIVALLKNNAKQRDVPTINPEHYAIILAVIEAALGANK